MAPPSIMGKFCHHMMPHPMFAHFGHQMELFALIANLATCILLQIGTTCIGSKFGHEVAPLALVLKLATRLHQCIATLPWIALLALSVGIELVSSLARVTSVKSSQSLGLSNGHPDPKIGPQVYVGPIKIRAYTNHLTRRWASTAGGISWRELQLKTLPFFTQHKSQRRATEIY